MAAFIVSQPDPLSVDPGSTAMVTVQIHNLSTIVERYDARLLGDLAKWCRVEPPSVSLFPNTSDEMHISCAPPRDPSARAGQTTLGLRIEQASDKSQAQTIEIPVVIALFVEVQTKLEPETSRSFWRGRHVLSVANDGNVALPVAVGAVDPNKRLQLVVRPPVVTLGPGERSSVRISARATSGSGRHERIPFACTVQPEGQPVKSVPAAFIKQRIPLVPIIAAAVVAACLISILLRGNGIGPVAAASLTVPTTTVFNTTTTAGGNPTTTRGGNTTTTGGNTTTTTGGSSSTSCANVQCTLQASAAASVTVTTVYDPATVSSDSVEQPNPGDQLVAVMATLKNNSTGDLLPNFVSNIASLTDSSGNVASADTSDDFTVDECQSFNFANTMGAGQSETGCFIFQIPMNTKPTQFQLFFSPSPTLTWNINIVTPPTITVPPTTTVPSLMGQSDVAAAQQLQQADLQVSVTYQASSTTPAGQVITSNPSPGSSVPVGTTVTLVTSSGPPPP